MKVKTCNNSNYPSQLSCHELHHALPLIGRSHPCSRSSFFLRPGSLNVALPLSGPRFIQINTSEISAGDTPEIRDACPTVTGRTLMSFWRASVRKLGIF